VCYEILREILREARAFNAREFRVLASQAVIDSCSRRVGLARHAVGIHRKPVSMQVESSYTQSSSTSC